MNKRRRYRAKYRRLVAKRKQEHYSRPYWPARHQHEYYHLALRHRNAFRS